MHFLCSFFCILLCLFSSYRLDIRQVPLVSTQAVIKFAAKSKHNLHVKDVKLVDRRKTK